MASQYLEFDQSSAATILDVSHKLFDAEPDSGYSITINAFVDNVDTATASSESGEMHVFLEVGPDPSSGPIKDGGNQVVDIIDCGYCLKLPDLPRIVDVGIGGAGAPQLHDLNVQNVAGYAHGREVFLRIATPSPPIGAPTYRVQLAITTERME